MEELARLRPTGWWKICHSKTEYANLDGWTKGEDQHCFNLENLERSPSDSGSDPKRVHARLNDASRVRKIGQSIQYGMSGETVALPWRKGT